jgi:hypothetical protein
MNELSCSRARGCVFSVQHCLELRYPENNMRPRLQIRLAAALFASFVLTGCQSIQLNANTAAQLRVIDASPDAGGIDSYQNSAGLAYNLSRGMVTTYVPMQPGPYALSAAKAGTRQTLALDNVTLIAGRQYTTIIGNVMAGLQQTLYVDQAQPAPNGEIAVRLLDQATRAGAVDVYFVPGSGRLAFTAPLATNLNFGSNSGYLKLPAGTYALVVAPAGTSPTSSSATLLSGAQVGYASGAVRTVVLIDSPAAIKSFSEPQSGVLTPSVESIIAADSDAN